ncbi:reverse transcriptase domain-containing protein [Tanacetum coccineum]
MVVEAPSKSLSNEQIATKGIKVAIHPEYPEQTITIGERMLAHKAKKKRISTEHEQSHPRRSYQARRSSNHKGGALPQLALEPSHGRNLEVYVDDLVIKIHMEQEILRDVEETFQTLRKINMKLNPKKCTFGAEEGMFIGHIINMKGIRACLNKVEVVIKLESPRTLKEGRTDNLSLRAREAVSVVLLKERDSQQMPVYFVSYALQAPKINYNSMEKLVLALVHASRRLRRYFHAHLIAVITDQPITQILSQPENAGRILKWRFKQDAFDIIQTIDN